MQFFHIIKLITLNFFLITEVLIAPFVILFLILRSSDLANLFYAGLTK